MHCKYTATYYTVHSYVLYIYTLYIKDNKSFNVIIYLLLVEICMLHEPLISH